MPEFRNVAFTIKLHVVLSRSDITVTDITVFEENGRIELSLNTESEIWILFKIDSEWDLINYWCLITNAALQRSVGYCEITEKQMILSRQSSLIGSVWFY